MSDFDPNQVAVISTSELPADWSVLLPLVYFDIFDHPLKAEEIVRFCPTKISILELEMKLKDGVDKNLIYKFSEYYTLKNNENIISDRIKAENRAEKSVPIARNKSKLIAKFPFVRSVCISGSLSKHIMQEDSDIDFFIITSPQKVWIARTLLIIYKKIFLFNSHKYFCLNYFIDSDHLEIKEKNLYTAVETATLRLFIGQKMFSEFTSQNQWIYRHFPNLEIPSASPAEVPQSMIKNAIERVLNNSFGDSLNRLFMKLTLSYWKYKFKSYSKDHFGRSFKSADYISTHHPSNFEQKILAVYTDKITKFEADNKIKIRV